jgi:hypothetical protein
MPNLTSPEAIAIQDAYTDQLKLLFSHLCTNMESLPDQESLGNFTNGFNIATRAKALALGVVVSAQPTTQSLLRVTEKRKTR